MPKLTELLFLLVCAGVLFACSEDNKNSASPDAGDTDSNETIEQPSLTLFHDQAPLTELGEQAIFIAPAWLRHDLGMALRQQEENRADELAGVLLDLTDPRLIDEVAFTIAHTSPEVIASDDFYPELFEVNARLIYEHDLLLDYVELQENGEAGVDDDFWTTATYTFEEEGSLVQKTVDREIYYWYVVHPKIEDEHPWFIDSWAPCGAATLECSAPPEDGWFWREFMWDVAAEICETPDMCPVLSDWLPDVEYVWNGLEGGESEGAVTEIIRFMLSEPVEGTRWLTFGASGERSIQPNRIYGLGRGNCGEWADMTTALTRTALIPNLNATPASWDHTWNSFWKDAWVEWEPVNFWVDHAYNVPFSNYGARGDGFIELQTPDYTDDWFTMEVEVTDSEGTPISGADVAVYSPWEIDEVMYWAYAGEATTDELGVASFPLVAQQQFAVRIESPIGSYPAEDNKITYASDGVPVGDTDLQTFAVDAVLPAALPSTSVGFEDESVATVSMIFSNTEGRTRALSQRFATTFTEENSPPTLEVLIVDEANLELMNNGDNFDAAWVGEAGDTTVDIPLGNDWYIVISNTTSPSVAAFGDLSLEINSSESWSESVTLDLSYEILPLMRMVFLIAP